jgi:hypothetical protein
LLFGLHIVGLHAVVENTHGVVGREDQLRAAGGGFEVVGELAGHAARPEPVENSLIFSRAPWGRLIWRFGGEA